MILPLTIIFFRRNQHRSQLNGKNNAYMYVFNYIVYQLSNGSNECQSNLKNATTFPIVFTVGRFQQFQTKT